MPNLCAGGCLASVVFCCSIKKPCPVRDYALKKLGIDPKQYEEIKERFSKHSADLCWGSLAYCCSPEKRCPVRDKVLQELGWSYSDYLSYKAQILHELIKEFNLDENKLFSEKVVKQAVGVFATEDGSKYNFLGLSAPELGLLFVVYIEPKGLDEKIRRMFYSSGEKVIPVRLDSETFEKLSILVGKGVFSSFNEAINKILKMYLAVTSEMREKV